MNDNFYELHLKQLREKEEKSHEAILNSMFERAKKAKPKGSYIMYSSFKRELEVLPLSNREYQKAIIRLADILRV